MTTEVGPVKREEKAVPLAAVAPVAPTPTIAPAPLPPRNIPVGGDDVKDFVRDHRIHIKHGSQFIDPYLVVHPSELNPANESRLREKLDLTYSINNPSFYETPERVAVAINLGQLVPVSLQAKRSKLLEEVKAFNEQVQTGTDSELAQQAKDKREPFSAIVRDTVNNPTVDPVGLELLKNGLAVYMLCRQKLTEQHFLGKLTDYVKRTGTPDQILADLQEKIGVSPQAVREAALKEGVDGVGRLLGLDAHYINDVKQLAEYASTQDFGYNIVEHWHIGRQLQPQLPLMEKIALGKQTRINAKINEYRGRVRGHYEVPEPIKKEEERIAQALELVDPIQRKLMFALGYEICFTPEVTADDIAFYKGIYGLHRKAANDLSDIRGTYRIYFSGHGDLEGSMRTLVHEIAHNLWPDHFTPQDVQAIDRLAASDAQRFTNLNRLITERFGDFEKLLGAYHAGSPQEKAAVLAAANEHFASYGVAVDQLFPHLADAHGFKFMVRHALDTLQVEGDRYNRSGYDTPQERFREVLSRFAELKQVRFRNQPELLNFVAPGLNQIFDQHYLPHLHRVYNDIQQHGLVRGKPNMGRDEAPEPKIKEQVTQGTPVKPTGNGHACEVDSQVHAAPSANVNLKHLSHNGVAALDALNAMGVNTQH